ncbi:hypothetical protein NMG60_11035328 [Bertholletia excelsa]
MRGMLAVVRRNLQNMRKSHRVADESMFGGENIGADEPIRSGWSGFSVICSVMRAPLYFLSCLSQPHTNGADGVWVSSDLARISEMNHLMVNDSMRYAILM